MSPRCPTEDDDDEADGVEGLNDEGLLASAEACYKALKGYFETGRVEGVCR